MFSEVVVDGFWTFLSSATSLMPANVNSLRRGSGRLNRVMAGNSTLRVYWKGLLSSSGVQKVAGG